MTAGFRRQVWPLFLTILVVQENMGMICAASEQHTFTLISVHGLGFMGFILMRTVKGWMGGRQMQLSPSTTSLLLMQSPSLIRFSFACLYCSPTFLLLLLYFGLHIAIFWVANFCNETRLDQWNVFVQNLILCFCAVHHICVFVFIVDGSNNGASSTFNRGFTSYWFCPCIHRWWFSLLLGILLSVCIHTPQPLALQETCFVIWYISGGVSLIHSLTKEVFFTDLQRKQLEQFWIHGFHCHQLLGTTYSLYDSSWTRFRQFSTRFSSLCAFMILAFCQCSWILWFTVSWSLNLILHMYVSFNLNCSITEKIRMIVGFLSGGIKPFKYKMS